MLTLINPATEETLAEIEQDTESTISHKFEKAKGAFNEWAQTPYEKRCDILGRFHGLLQDRIEPCATTLSQEMGKPTKQARSEIAVTLDRIKWFMEHCEKLLRTETVYEDSRVVEKISYDPLGVIGNISAWNYPYFVGSNVFVPALLTGNCVLYKPSEICSLTGLKFQDLFWEAGLPEGCFQTVVGDSSQGKSLLTNPVHGVFFTGSYAAGQNIVRQCSDRLVHSGFELGGKDPAYVSFDADIQEASDSLTSGSFYNSGQSCCAVERIYVHGDVYDDFVAAFSERAKELKVGDPTLEETELGPLSRREQMPFLDSQVTDALEKGASAVVEGGQTKVNGKGWFYSPSVFVNVNHQMRLMTEESFGPVIGIQKVKDDQEAVEKMNDTHYGLTAGVFTKEEDRAKWILERVDAGTVYHNLCDRVSPFVPWSGRKNSGLGSTLSEIGIRSFTRPKAWQSKKV